MKKIIALLLVLYLLLPGQCVAEEFFTFSNGIRWGMSMDEIVAIEGDSYQGPIGAASHLKLFGYDNKKISKYSVYKYYVLCDDSLFCVLNVFLTLQEEDDVAYLVSAVSSLYGDPSPSSLQDLEKYLEAVNGSADMEGITDVYHWQPAQNTSIWMYCLSGMYGMFYIDETFDVNGINPYDTTGL